MKNLAEDMPKNIPTAIFLDDNPDTVEPHAKQARDLGYQVRKCEDIKELYAELKYGYWWMLLFVDQHMPDIRDLGAVNLPQISTDGGENVGVAVVRGLLPHLRLNRVPVRVLSNYQLSPTAQKQIKTAAKRGRDVDYIKKPDTDAVRRLLEEQLANNPIDRVRNFTAAEHFVSSWALEDMASVPTVFGYDRMDLEDWKSEKQNIMRHMDDDIVRRTDAIILVKETLASLFGGEDANLEANWLREKDSNLDDKSPWEMMTSKKQYDLLRLAGLMGRILA